MRRVVGVLLAASLVMSVVALWSIADDRARLLELEARAARLERGPDAFELAEALLKEEVSATGERAGQRKSIEGLQERIAVLEGRRR